MTVRIRGLGSLRSWFGDEARPITLQSGGRLRDLMRAIEDQWADSLPFRLWDREKDAAGPPVVILVAGKRVTDMDTPLEEDQEIILWKASVGG